MALPDDLNRLVARPPADKRLPAAGTPAPIRSKTGLERLQEGRIRSEEATVQSTDGLFAFTIQVARSA